MIKCNIQFKLLYGPFNPLFRLRCDLTIALQTGEMKRYASTLKPLKKSIKWLLDLIWNYLTPAKKTDRNSSNSTLLRKGNKPDWTNYRLMGQRCSKILLYCLRKDDPNRRT